MFAKLELIGFIPGVEGWPVVAAEARDGSRFARNVKTIAYFGGDYDSAMFLWIQPPDKSVDLQAR